MGAAWVGPLHWTQWAGGHCRLIPRRRRTGPGGEPRLPDRARSRWAAGGGAGGGTGAGAGTEWVWIRPDNPAPKRNTTVHYVRLSSHPAADAPSENGRMTSVGRGWAERFADTRRAVGGRTVGWPDFSRYRPSAIGDATPGTFASVAPQSATPSARPGPGARHLPSGLCQGRMRFRRAPSVATPARRCRGSMFATALHAHAVLPTCSGRAVLSTACGGGDALVGGVEQYRREFRHGRCGRRR